jgi:hypothetical protein
MPSTYSLTSEADAVAATSAVCVIGADGYEQKSAFFTWVVKEKADGVHISRVNPPATSQAPPVFPVAREEALDLARILLKVCT